MPKRLVSERIDVFAVSSEEQPLPLSDQGAGVPHQSGQRLV